MLGRTIATLDHILKGRLTINIISSNLPETNLNSNERYQRSREVIEILKQGWTQEQINYKGEFYNIQLASTAPTLSTKWWAAIIFWWLFSFSGTLCLLFIGELYVELRNVFHAKGTEIFPPSSQST